MNMAIFEAYKRFCYSLFHCLDRRPNDRIAGMLYQADIEMTPGIFLSLILTSVILSALAMLLSSILLFAFSWSPFFTENSLLYVVGLTLACAVVVGFAFPFSVQNRISNKKQDIERKLPYALSFMSILAASGTTPLEVLRRVAHEDYGHISREFSKVLFRVDVLGEDVVTAMNDLIAYTPSAVFRTICIDLNNIMYGGGGLREYLAAKSRDLMEIRRQSYKEFVESLAVFAEGYLGGIVLLLTLSVLGIIISGALSIDMGPFSAGMTLSLVIYLLTPLINIVFLQVLSVKYSTSP